MTTNGGGWTLVAAAVGGVNMPRFNSTTVNACTAPSPTAPCFLGADNLAALPFTEVVWSTAPNPTPTREPIDGLVAGDASVNAICISATEYYRFNQDIASQGMGWTGCVPTEYYLSLASCRSMFESVWNLLRCDGLAVAPGPRSSPDYNCSPFGESRAFGPVDLCQAFTGVRHWRR
jgi:hypothetical protein